MAGTTTKGLRYPTSGDNPAVHTDIQNLATDVDTLFNNYLGSTVTSIDFEGTTVDGYETTLNAIDPTADRTVSLPNNSGTIALTSDVNTSALTVQTYAEHFVRTNGLMLGGM